jgi:hypothetical protein
MIKTLGSKRINHIYPNQKSSYDNRILKGSSIDKKLQRTPIQHIGKCVLNMVNIHPLKAFG